ncbi:hypothetical protein QOT17_003392 [Balamuthia mandrillaris]
MLDSSSGGISHRLVSYGCFGLPYAQVIFGRNILDRIGWSVRHSELQKTILERIKDLLEENSRILEGSSCPLLSRSSLWGEYCSGRYAASPCRRAKGPRWLRRTQYCLVFTALPLLMSRLTSFAWFYTPSTTLVSVSVSRSASLAFHDSDNVSNECTFSRTYIHAGLFPHIIA